MLVQEDSSELLTSNRSSITRGHNYQLFKLQSSTKVRSSFFTVTVRAINALH